MSKILDAAAIARIAWKTGMPRTVTLRGILSILPYLLRRASGPHMIYPMHAKNIPDKTALIDGGRSWSYREFFEEGAKVANALLDMGVRPGEKLALVIDNCAEYQIVSFAGAYMGASIVPVSTHLKEKELAYILDHCDAKSVVCSQKYYPLVGKVVSKLPLMDRARCIVIGDGDFEPMRSYREIVGAYRAKPVYTNAGKIDNNLMIYTSGTTGRPKGASRSFESLDPIVVFSVIETFAMHHDDIFYTPCPFYHSAPTAFNTITMFVGGTIVIAERFDPGEFLDLVERHRITSAMLVPTLCNRLTRLTKEEVEARDLSSLRAIFVGASFCPPTLKRRIMELFGDHLLYDVYGATEMGLVTTAKPQDVARRPDTIGKAMRGVDIRLLDDEGREAPVGEPGELYVKTSYLIDEYYKNKEATSRSLRDGYFTVGDIARKDEDGYFYILDRKSDMVVTGGVNVYPAEIEEELMQHPALYEAAVVGQPDEEWGEALVAFVVLKEGEEAAEKEIIDWIGSRMARYKKPKRVEFVAELPHNPQGKVLKRELRRMLAEKR